MTTAELTVSTRPATAQPDAAAAPLLNTPTKIAPLDAPVNYTHLNSLYLISGDALLLVLAGALLAAHTGLIGMMALGAPLLALNAKAGLYPGFGLLSAERLRRRWLLTLSTFGTFALLSLSVYPLLAGLMVMALNPLLDEMTRAMLHRRGKWGKPVMVLANERQMSATLTNLQQNWQLGLMPYLHGESDTAVIGAGAVTNETLARYQEVYAVREAGMLYQLNTPGAWAGNMRARDPGLLPWRMFKRSLDVIISVLALTLSLPVMAVAAAFIYAIDPGPVFYGQLRRGQNGKPVRIYKLRSMYTDSQERLERLLAQDQAAEREWNRRYKLTNDPRILPLIGKFIRKYSIDELPQLWSVLKGDMSVVGPRVFIDYDLAVYTPEALRLRQSVPPGLTGLWQVSVRSDGDNKDKERYDLAYVRNWSFWLDLDVLYRTVGVVLTGRGAV